jgi:hypothetical protein
LIHLNFAFRGAVIGQSILAKTAQRNACYYERVLSNNTSGAMIRTTAPEILRDAY